MLRFSLAAMFTLLIGFSAFAQNAHEQQYVESDQMQMAHRIVWLLHQNNADGLASFTSNQERIMNEKFEANVAAAAKLLPEFHQGFYRLSEKVDSEKGIHKVYVVLTGGHDGCEMMMEIHYPVNNHTVINELRFHKAGTFDEICAGTR